MKKDTSAAGVATGRPAAAAAFEDSAAGRFPAATSAQSLASDSNSAAAASGLSDGSNAGTADSDIVCISRGKLRTPRARSRRLPPGSLPHTHNEKVERADRILHEHTRAESSSLERARGRPKHRDQSRETPAPHDTDCAYVEGIIRGPQLYTFIAPQSRHISAGVDASPALDASRTSRVSAPPPSCLTAALA